MAGHGLWWNAYMLLVQVAAGACGQGGSGAFCLASFDAVLTELIAIPAHHAAFDVYKRYALCLVSNCRWLQGFAELVIDATVHTSGTSTATSVGSRPC